MFWHIPGSGKTAVITQRTKQLIEYENIDPSNILVITFYAGGGTGDEAAFSCIDRRRENESDLRYVPRHIFMVLKLAYHFDSGNIISEEQRYQFMRRFCLIIIWNTEMKGIYRDVLTEISRVKNEQIPLEHFYSSSCGRDFPEDLPGI